MFSYLGNIFSHVDVMLYSHYAVANLTELQFLFCPILLIPVRHNPKTIQWDTDNARPRRPT